MKYTGICPKCKLNNVIEIKNNKMNMTNYLMLNKWGTKLAYYDSYLCSDCGFIEHFVQVDDKLDKNIEGVEFYRPNPNKNDDFL